MINSRIWAGNVARIGERRGVYRVWVGINEVNDYLGDPGVDGRIILRRILRKWDVGVMEWIELAQSIGENYIMRSLIICTAHQIFFW